MKYYSLKNIAPKVSFRQAVIKGIAPDKGLYFPESITPLPPIFFESIEDLSKEEIAFQAMLQFVRPSLPVGRLKKIIAETLRFNFPLVPIEDDIAALELFHGPTMAFKDVGARFMAQSLEYFRRKNSRFLTVLVATSGDTGGAVASGFLGTRGIKVVILYPKGKISEIQERQLTTLGANISAVRVDGTFDDCQEMVKTAFLDKALQKKRPLTSANSINVARWLPQMFYYLFAYRELKKHNRELVFSVPSGNFGNLCAGMVAKKLGMPCKLFIAATNINDAVPRYLKTGTYQPEPSHATISNAMDVGDPSNFVRILQLYRDNPEGLKKDLVGYSFSDDQTREAMEFLYINHGYIADPHGAVGYLGLRKFLKNNPGYYGVFLETAHPAKFLDVVSDTLDIPISLPPQLSHLSAKDKEFTDIKTYSGLRDYLLSSVHL